MRYDGKLVKWDDDRGFGFIGTRDGGNEVFVHVSAFPRPGPRPQVGEMLSFEVEAKRDGRKQAVRIRRVGHVPPPRRQGSRVGPARVIPRPMQPSFTCDGRTHCSQMTSCEEATFFVRNCPGTRMDGDNDGIPCEREWCTRR